MKKRDYGKFRTQKKEEVKRNNDIWIYTRVSSKEQALNFSIQSQIEDIEAFAIANNYRITAREGGEYESASGKVDRKEFKSLIERLTKSKIKPFALAIKFVSRFSREGGSAIGLVDDLISKYGVHIIETSSGLCTDNVPQKLEIYAKLLESQKENIIRLERTIPGMKTFMTKGNWLGKAPRGYTTYGPRVTNFQYRREKQSIEINEEGLLLKKAWKWKVEGIRDVDIRKKLEHLGLKISKQSLSAMWDKPFYCGINNNSMLKGKDWIKGNWPPLVSEEVFWKIQSDLDKGRNKGYQVEKLKSEYPLKGFLFCSDCGSPLTGSTHKKKQIHYYKCQNCKGQNMNAFTEGSRKKGVNDAFIELLNSFTMSEKYVGPLKLQLLKLCGDKSREKEDLLKSLTKQKVDQQNKIEQVEENYLLSPNPNQEAYQRIIGKLNEKLDEILADIQSASKNLSNSEIVIDQAIHNVQNISNYWERADIYKRQRIQKLIFPEGLTIEPQNRTYRTSKTNELFDLISTIVTVSENSKNKKATRKGGLSSTVAGTGLEPVTFGL